MNATLRARHRRLTTGLAIVVPIGIAVALAARPSPPTVERLPVAEPSLAAFTATVGQADTVRIGDATLNMTLLRSASSPTRFAVRVAPATGRGVAGPDVLVYWHATAAPIEAGVPKGAFLVGTLAGGQQRVLPLPGVAVPGAGQLVFYSLAHQKTYATPWPLPAAP